ncbi:MAG: cation:proton antiporter [Candidatus Saganbacteria bacterium]|nr:cation:proton antiporter [Candidatus Saganbacteria bacterium]
MEKEFLYFGTILIAAAIFALLSKKVKQSTIAGYLLVGAIARFFVEPSASFEFLSSLGAILLLFFVGLEFSINKVKGLGKKILTLGIIDFAVNFPLGIGCGLLFGWSPLEALFLGGIVYISSSAVISKLLVDSGCMPRRETRTVLGILIIEDIIMAVILAVFSALAYKPVIEFVPLSIALAKAILFCSFFILLEKPIRKLFNYIYNVKQNEIFILEVIGTIFLVSVISKYLGLSEATGAFFIGSAMADSIHKHRIKSMLEPLGFFAATLFFLSFGLQVNLLAVNSNILITVVILIVVSIAGKLITGLAAKPIEKLSFREAQNVGFSLFSRGEFSILIASLFIKDSLAGSGIKEIIAIYVFVLMILSSFLIKRYTNTCQIEDP